MIARVAIESDAFSRDLKRRGFNFVGSTVIYAYMQAIAYIYAAHPNLRKPPPNVLIVLFDDTRRLPTSTSVRPYRRDLRSRVTL
jgi:hypothetical protein